MLTLSGITKRFGERTLFANVSLQVNRGDRLGLVGPNGAGKSTLFAIIRQQEPADAGSVVMPRGTMIGFLPQESAPAGQESVLELATAVTSELAELRRKLLSAAAETETEGPDQHEARRRFDTLDGYRVEANAKRVLAGLGFRERDFTRPRKGRCVRVR